MGGREWIEILKTINKEIEKYNNNKSNEYEQFSIDIHSIIKETISKNIDIDDFNLWKAADFAIDYKFKYNVDWEKEESTLVQSAVAQGLITLFEALIRIKSINNGATISKTIAEEIKLKEDDSSIISDAIYDKHFDMVKYIYENCDEDIDEVVSATLKTAASCGYLEIFKYHMEDDKVSKFLKKEAIDKCLLLAVGYGHFSIVTFVLERNEDAKHLRNEYNASLLHLASSSGEMKTVRYLVDDKGLNIEAVDDGQLTSFHFAALNGQKEVVEYLLEKGADIDAVDNEGCTALHLTVEAGKLDLIKYLADEKGADLNKVDKLGRNALHFAALGDYYDRDCDLNIIKYFVEHKNMDINAKDFEGATPLLLSVKNETNKGHARPDLKVIEYFIENGADFTITDNKGFTALHYSVDYFVFPYSFEICEYLLIHTNIDINARDEEGMTVLHLASRSCSTEEIQFLIEVGNADFTLLDGNGLSVLHYAAKYRGGEDIFEYFVAEKKLNVSTVDKKNATPLHYAVNAKSYNCFNVVKCLIELGVDVHIKNNDGKTAMDLALENNRDLKDVIDLFRDHLGLPKNSPTN